ncbi:nucleotide sugar dehydrogenase [Cryptosporangium minutisporangium]|uniref:Nucleotide sugar dehydrogenase n=1 Tax=Cryptosporangium minutisporangium TaxID=113569 RepID=A0ABP6SUP3_9ACTN
MSASIASGSDATPLGVLVGPLDDLAPTPSRFAFDVAVVGLGYVGLPTALAFHAAGQRVLGVEVSADRVAAVRARAVDLLPSDRSRLDTALTGPDTFALSTDPRRLSAAAAILVCVPTPVDEHLVPDLTALAAACRTVAANAVPGQLLVLTSTSYVGCTRDLLIGPLRQRGYRPGDQVAVAFAPERIDPGNARHPQEAVPRVVGGATPSCRRRALGLLAGYADALHPVSSLETAELTKLVENTFRAVNIALANEFADIAGALDLDVTEVIDAAATKPFGFMPFYPGPGVGGHCIPCDPHYLLWQLRAARLPAPVVEAAMGAVAARPRQVARRAGEVLAECGRSIAGADVLLLGVAYKSGVSDVRESPAVEVARYLRRAGATVWFADPLVTALDVDGTALRRVEAPHTHSWDLVIVHTAHAGQDTGWLAAQPLVLDATYRLRDLPGRRVV